MESADPTHRPPSPVRPNKARNSSTVNRSGTRTQPVREPEANAPAWFGGSGLALDHPLGFSQRMDPATERHIVGVREHDDRQSSGRRTRSKARERGQPIDPWQSHVQQDEIATTPARQLNRAAPVVRDHHVVSGDRQPEAEHLCHLRIVLDQQDRGGSHRGARTDGGGGAGRRETTSRFGVPQGINQPATASLSSSSTLPRIIPNRSCWMSNTRSIRAVG